MSRQAMKQTSSSVAHSRRLSKGNRRYLNGESGTGTGEKKFKIHVDLKPKLGLDVSPNAITSASASNYLPTQTYKRVDSGEIRN